MENVKKTKEKKIFQNILKITEAILTVIVLFISAVIIIQRVSSNEKTFLGFRIFRVETGSMMPQYNIADVILVKEKDINKIKIGDDLVYRGEKGNTKGKTITHRVVRIDEDENGEIIFYTKGIANNKEDPAVYGRQVMGVVQQKLYTITFVMHLLLNGYTFYFIIILPFTIYLFFAGIHEKERKVRKEIRTRNKKAKEKEEKEKTKQRAREDRKSQMKLGTKNIKRIDSKENKETK